MKTLFTALTVLTLVFGTFALPAVANAATGYHFPTGTQYEGNNN